MPPLPCAGQRLAADQPGRGRPQSAPTALHRQIEGEPSHQMRSQSHEPVAFGEAFSDQSDLAIFQIPQAAMDQPGRPGGGARGDVAAIDDDHSHAGEREFPGNRGTIDSRSKHDDRCFSCHGRLSSLPPPAVCSGGIPANTIPRTIPGTIPGVRPCCCPRHPGAGLSLLQETHGRLPGLRSAPLSCGASSG